jgi:hypothetical protein
VNAQSSRDKVRAQFEAAITSSYDVSEVLAAFWLYAGPLIKLECDALPPGRIESTKEARELITGANARSFLEGNVDQERDVILRAAGIFKQVGLNELGSLLQLFLAALTDRTEAPAEPSHCQFFVDKLTCHACGYVGSYLIWHFINTALRPEMEERAVSGEFCDGPKCLMCDVRLGAMPFFYCNPAREEFIAYTLRIFRPRLREERLSFISLSACRWRSMPSLL